MVSGSVSHLRNTTQDSVSKLCVFLARLNPRYKRIMADEGTTTDGAGPGPTPEMIACIQKVVEETVRRLVVRPSEGSSSGEGTPVEGAAGSTPASAAGEPIQRGWLV